ncbi:hypothetical protein [Duncaniella muris]|uniref:hypothetical protein n=1 Tax=Duncaniella muris TaxID=2094150 RepID=UPI0027364586|nr:hypothetical protein [Duncaniella muris]
MKDFEVVAHNAAVRGYILRLLVKGYHHTLTVRRVSDELLGSDLITDPDIWEPLEYLHDLGFIEFTKKQITPANAYQSDGVIHLTRKGIQFIESDVPEDLGIDL